MVLVDEAPSTQVRLRLHLKLAHIANSEPRQYLIEDRITSRYYRIGAREYAVINALAQYRDVYSACQQANASLGERALSEGEVQEMMQWLHAEQLIEVEGQSLPNIQKPNAGLLRWLNLMTFRIPLGNPDRLLNVLSTWFGFMASRWFFVVWLAVCFSGVLVVASNWTAFDAAAGGVFYVNNWISLMAIWAIVKIAHEMFHGIVCKRFGGNVFEAGIILILFIPIGYVDATSSWRFGDKWQRLFTALAGMYIELLCAAIASWIWILSEPGIVNDLAYQTMILASVTTLFFNANPLMRFDGYFALSDLVNTPNLYAHGRRYVAYLGQRYLLGDKGVFDTSALAHPNFVKVYGVLALVWRTTVIIALIIAANALFHGAGVIVAASAVVSVLAIPLWRNTAAFVQSRSRKSVALAMMRSALLLCLIVMGFRVVSWENEIVAPAVVNFSDYEAIYSKSAGFVETVNAKSGQRVSAGDSIVRLRNFELQQKFEVLEFEIAQSQLKIRILQNTNNTAKAANERRNLAHLRRLADAARQELEDLDIAAPDAGTLYAPDLKNAVGRYFEAGEVIAELRESSSLEVIVSIGQQALNHTRIEAGQAIKVRFPSTDNALNKAIVKQIDPRLSRHIEYSALAGSNGGAVPVRMTQQGGNEGTFESAYEFLEPRGKLIATPQSNEPGSLFAGETGFASLPGERISVATWLAERITTWLHGLVRQAENTTAN